MLQRDRDVPHRSVDGDRCSRLPGLCGAVSHGKKRRLCRHNVQRDDRDSAKRTARSHRRSRCLRIWTGTTARRPRANGLRTSSMTTGEDRRYAGGCAAVRGRLLWSASSGHMARNKNGVVTPAPSRHWSHARRKCRQPDAVNPAMGRPHRSAVPMATAARNGSFHPPLGQYPPRRPVVPAGSA